MVKIQFCRVFEVGWEQWIRKNCLVGIVTWRFPLEGLRKTRSLIHKVAPAKAIPNGSLRNKTADHYCAALSSVASFLCNLRFLLQWIASNRTHFLDLAEVRSCFKQDLFPYDPWGSWRIRHVSNYREIRNASQLQSRWSDPVNRPGCCLCVYRNCELGEIVTVMLQCKAKSSGFRWGILSCS
jgi:hypothetical protein